MSYQPTDEQQAFIDAAVARTNIAGQAGAGTGKTTTAEAMIRAIRNASGGLARIAYFVYNKEMQLEAATRFGHLADVRTAHSLAYGAVGKYYAQRLRNSDTIKPWYLAPALGYRKPLVGTNSQGMCVAIKPRSLAALAQLALKRFQYSADPEIAPQHVSPPAGVSGEFADEVIAAVVSGANIIWADQQNQLGQHRFTHDSYLKMFQLQIATRGWHLPYDVIIVDEAQDTNPVFADIINRQIRAQRIALGDSAQAIYGWRGCEDYLADFGQLPGVVNLSLTQSWRFGQAIADEGNLWLEHGDFDLRITGHPGLDSRIGPVDDGRRTILHRTNSGAVDSAIRAARNGHTVHIKGGAAKAIETIEDVLKLKNGGEVKNPMLSAVRDYNSLKDLVAAGLIDDQEITIAVRVVDEHGQNAVDAIRACNHDATTADVVVATSHSYKGREADQVVIGDDFRAPEVGPNNPQGLLSLSECMLHYVAVTRARMILDNEGLAWGRRIPFGEVLR